MRLVTASCLAELVAWCCKQDIRAPVKIGEQQDVNSDTVLCKRNANEIRCFSFFVLAKIRRNFATNFRQSAREFSWSQTNRLSNYYSSLQSISAIYHTPFAHLHKKTSLHVQTTKMEGEPSAKTCSKGRAIQNSTRKRGKPVRFNSLPVLVFARKRG